MPLSLAPSSHLSRKHVFRAELAPISQLRKLLRREHVLELCSGFAGLGRVRLIGDDRERLALGGGQLANLFERKGERLDCADDDLLASSKRLRQLTTLALTLALDSRNDA